MEVEVELEVRWEIAVLKAVVVALTDRVGLGVARSGGVSDPAVETLAAVVAVKTVSGVAVEVDVDVAVAVGVADQAPFPSSSLATPSVLLPSTFSVFPSPFTPTSFSIAAFEIAVAEAVAGIAGMAGGCMKCVLLIK